MQEFVTKLLVTVYGQGHDPHGVRCSVTECRQIKCASIAPGISVTAGSTNGTDPWPPARYGKQDVCVRGRDLIDRATARLGHAIRVKRKRAWSQGLAICRAL